MRCLFCRSLIADIVQYTYLMPKCVVWTVQVESAGHMVPLDQPAASAFVIDTLVGPLLSKK